MYYDEDTVLAWIKIKESIELRNIHTKLCEKLKAKFEIEPLGFDGEHWTFHSTLTYSKIDNTFKPKIYDEYNGKVIKSEFEANEAVVFCCLEDCSRTCNYFSLKIFNIGN